MTDIEADTGTRDETLELRSGALRLALRPDLGGSVAGLWHHHVPVWCSTEPHALVAAEQAACIPLVPYAYRLGYARLRWKGQDLRLEPDASAHPHALHGVGWRQRWALRSHSPLDAVLVCTHQPDDRWPFGFEATQYFNLTPQALRIQMSVTNTGDQPQPVGMGWRPRFVRRLRSRLHAELTERWEADDAQLPTRSVSQPGIDGDVAHLSFCHGFEGWRGAMRIRDETFSLQLSSSMSRLVVSTTEEADAFAVSPVSHVVNAIHMADPALHGLVTLQPGESCEAWMKLEIAPR